MIYFHLSFMFLAVILTLGAVLMIIKKPQGWFNLHKTLGTSALICALLAFGLLFYFKSQHHYPHFKSDHAIGGAITLLLLIFTVAFGTMAAKGHKLSRKIHILIGGLTTLLLMIATAVGVDHFLDIMKK